MIATTCIRCGSKLELKLESDLDPQLRQALERLLRLQPVCDKCQAGRRMGEGIPPLPKSRPTVEYRSPSRTRETVLCSKCLKTLAGIAAEMRRAQTVV
jgi:hypothetical protein